MVHIMRRHLLGKTFSVAVLAFVWPFALSAAPPIQEMYISTKGEVHIVGAEIISKNALNLLGIKIWGEKRLLAIPDHTDLKAADGSVITAENLSKGDFLEIKGHSAKDSSGFLEASYIRNFSLKNENIPYPSLSAAFCPAPVALKVLPSSTQAPVPTAVVSEIKPPAQITVSQPAPVTGKREITQNLFLGIRGGEVTILQEFLQKNGWGIPNDATVTGFFGQVTESALKKFQETQGLEATGNTGPLSRAAINSLLKGKTSSVTKVSVPSVPPAKIILTQDLKAGMKGGEVVVLQEFLQKHSWGIPDDGPVTGFFGRVTEQAVINFQKAKGLAAIGAVDFKTRELINLLLKNQ